MKKLIALGILILVLLSAFIFKAPLVSYAQNSLYYSPCDTPIAYSIGRIDPEFNLSETEVLRRAKIAEKIWEDAAQKNLLEFDPKSPFTIDVIYDGRHSLSENANKLGSELQAGREDIETRLETYDRNVAQFKADLESLNTDISYWNSRGGAPEEEYNKLLERQEELSQRQQELQKEAELLNQSTDEFNAQTFNLNNTIQNLNQALEEKPEGGLYTQHGNDKQITIFFNNSEEEFIYTTAHEMGHALGIGHVLDSTSIMYPNVNLILTPSEVDLEELSKACKTVSILEPIILRVQTAVKRLGSKSTTE
ncbi:MAG: matrixin family metalloprotease [Candidatus Levybacteria bacterium]|nr:matrixin family metalloprotease [Candidatus Levybacteria bacterium]